MEVIKTNKTKKFQTFISAGLILLIISQIFSLAIKDKMHQRIPEASDPYAQAISIAISRHNFGLKGYVGYQSVSQFSREYGRLFGSAPTKDIARLREYSTQELTQLGL